MDIFEALDIVMQPAVDSVANDAIDAEVLTEALDIIHFARPFLATALALAWQGAEPKLARTGQRALDLGG